MALRRLVCWFVRNRGHVAVSQGRRTVGRTFPPSRLRRARTLGPGLGLRYPFWLHCVARDYAARRAALRLDAALFAVGEGHRLRILARVVLPVFSRVSRQHFSVPACTYSGGAQAARCLHRRVWLRAAPNVSGCHSHGRRCGASPRIGSRIGDFGTHDAPVGSANSRRREATDQRTRRIRGLPAQSTLPAAAIYLVSKAIPTSTCL